MVQSRSPFMASRDTRQSPSNAFLIDSHSAGAGPSNGFSRSAYAARAPSNHPQPTRTRISTPTRDGLNSPHEQFETTDIIPTWSNLPNKGQLAILAASRFVDFFQMAALQTYMVHQLKSFDPDLPDSVISHQTGVLQGAFTAAQIVTSILWGRAADRPSLGRKKVLMIGLVGTGVGCIGVAFSTSYRQAVFWRLLSGAINGTVGAARTMVAERTPKAWHPRAFLLLPAAFNVANVAGPILSGMLVDPVRHLPQVFGINSTFGGPEGTLWLKMYPYALANLLCTFLLLGEALLVHHFLEETLSYHHDGYTHRFSVWQDVRQLYNHVVDAKDTALRALRRAQREGLLSGRDHGYSVDLDTYDKPLPQSQSPVTQTLPFKRIWTSNVLWTLLSIAVFDFHMGAFANLWILFLATPRDFEPPARSAARDVRSPRDVVKFAAGLAFPPPTIGFAMSIIGFIGVALQFLLYPWANAKFGLMRCFRFSLLLFPLAYILAPYIALLPSQSPAPEPSSGVLVWLGIAFVLFLQVAARTFALPASIILINNASPHPSVLATVHGLGQACSATFRTLGPVLSGYWFGMWTERGIIGMAWWITACVAAVGCAVSLKVRNGSGHEILLPGEEPPWRDDEESSYHTPPK